MKAQVRGLLKEAQHRYMRFHRDESLTEAWTGLGTRTAYEPVLEAELMRWVYRRPPTGASGWLRLTETGAKIVQDWIDEEASGEH